MDMKSECIPAAITNRPMSDFPILQLVIRRVRTGEAVLEREVERARMQSVLYFSEKLRNGVMEQARRKVEKIPA